MGVLERNNVHVLGDGPVMLYAHGFGCNQGMWNQITPAFRDTHRQVLFDYVGSGQSDLSAFDRNRYARLDGYARDIVEICEALDIERGVTLVAHSVSCSIGWLASIARPELFERMILIGPSPCFLNDPPDYMGGFEREDLEGLIQLMEQNYIGWANYLAPVAAGQTPDGEVTRTLTDSFCSTEPSTINVFARATFFADNRAELSRVRVPCLILQHQRDALAPPAVGEYLHACLPGSTLRSLDVAGHCAHLSHPELVIDAIRDVLPSGKR